MELWACGFNAWGQLNFEVENQNDEPKDVFEFRRVLTAEKIERISNSISSTLVSTPLSLHSKISAGVPDDVHDLLSQDTQLRPEFVAQAGNGKVTCGPAYTDGIITEYHDRGAIIQGGQKLLEKEDVKQVVANQTSFSALTTAGTVWSWGDERYDYCLGRKIDASHPASLPCLVDQLSDLPGGPIVKLGSGGYLTAALTLDNDLYIWGHRPGETPITSEIIEQMPTPLDIYGYDILDFGIGDRHIIVLTTDRKIFVIGEGVNGQLGALHLTTTKWLEITIPLLRSKEIVGVAAGPKNSFVLVSVMSV